VSQDIENGSKVNVAINLGKEKACLMIREELEAFFQTLKHLNIDAQEFKDIAKLLLP